jgi:hypothetical protein
MPAPSSLSTPAQSPQARLSPLTSASARVSPLHSPTHSFSYRRFSASTSRISDERGSGEKGDDPPEEAIEDELMEDKPPVQTAAAPREAEKERGGPLGMIGGRWSAAYGGRWKIGAGQSNERGVEDADSPASSGRPPSPARTPSVRDEQKEALAEKDELEAKVERESVDGDDKSRRRVRAPAVEGEESASAGSARKRKGKFSLTISKLGSHPQPSPLHCPLPRQLPRCILTILLRGPAPVTDGVTAQEVKLVVRVVPPTTTPSPHPASIQPRRLQHPRGSNALIGDLTNGNHGHLVVNWVAVSTWVQDLFLTRAISVMHKARRRPLKARALDRRRKMPPRNARHTPQNLKAVKVRVPPAEAVWQPHRSA